MRRLVERCQDSETPMKTRKQIFQDRIRRIVEHRENPLAPVDAATLLRNEGQRLRNLKHPLAAKAGWGMLLAAAKLESWGDPTCMVRYQKVHPLNERGMARRESGPPQQ